MVPIINKRKTAIVSAVVLLAALIAGGTLAVFTGQGRATNVITTGTIDISLNDSIAGGQKTEAGYTLDNVMPGSTVAKTVSVTNNGTGDAWIRINTNTVIIPPKAGPSPGTDAVRINYNLGGQGAHWFDGGDGWYYYSAPVKGASVTGKVTTPDLFSTVTLKKEMSDAYQNCKIIINVQAQAVQAKHNGEGLTELTTENLSSVQGWPESDAG